MHNIALQAARSVTMPAILLFKSKQAKMKKIFLLTFIFTWAKLYAQPANSLLQKDRNYFEAINETYSTKKNNEKINKDAALKERAAKWLSTKNEKGFLENRGQMMDIKGNPMPNVLFKTEAPPPGFWVGKLTDSV